LREIIVRAFAGMSAAQVIERLDKVGIANAQMNSMHDVWAHPQLKARERWSSVRTPAGQIPALLPPGLGENFAPRMDAVPALGEHTDSILRELGYDAARIATLRGAKAI
jgi:crotonobetainyl-CoA:carnitine CoA-transferase CaiB-like acyl-CoA transferase